MKHLGKVFISFVFVGAMTVTTTAPALAATESVTQELHVTAVVPHRRDIILDNKGHIIKILSNTQEDVTPQVFVRDTTPENKRQLTHELYEKYRRIVPEGTAEYGVLYERSILASLSKPNSRNNI